MVAVWEVLRGGGYSRGGRGDGGEEEARAVRGALRQGKETGPGASDGTVAVVAGAVAGLNNGGGREGDKGQSSDELHGGGLGWGYQRRRRWTGCLLFHRGARRCWEVDELCCKPASVPSYTPPGCPYAQAWR